MINSEVYRKRIGVECTEYTFEGTKRLSLYAQTWYSVETPKAIINIIHGLGEHCSRYAEWAKKLAQAGYTVRMFDLRGHGHSGGKLGHVPGYKYLLADIETFIHKGKEEYSDIPFYLLGHDMGASLAINYAIEQPQNTDGIIALSPWFKLTHKPAPLRMFLINVFHSILPAFIIKSPICTDNALFDLKTVHSFRSDTLNHQKISLRLYKQIQEYGEKASISIYKINCPMLVMHSNNNPVTSCKASQNFVRNASKKTQYIEWEGTNHEFHNNALKEEALNKITDWLNEYISPDIH